MSTFSNINHRLDVEKGFAEKVMRTSGMATGSAMSLVLIGLALGPIGTGLAIGAGLLVLAGTGVFGYSAYKGYKNIARDLSNTSGSHGAGQQIPLTQEPTVPKLLQALKHKWKEYAGQRCSQREPSNATCPPDALTPVPPSTKQLKID